MFYLIEKVSPDEAGDKLKEKIEKLTHACEVLREVCKKPFMLWAALPPDRIVLNHEL